MGCYYSFIKSRQGLGLSSCFCSKKFIILLLVVLSAGDGLLCGLIALICGWLLLFWDVFPLCSVNNYRLGAKIANL